MDAYLSDHDLVSILFRALRDEKQARKVKGDEAVTEHRAMIASMLSALSERGFCKLEIIHSPTKDHRT